MQELKDTATEFSRRGEFAVHLHLDTLAFELSASEQIHILQITREALSNCLRHAHAQNAWLELRQDGETVRLGGSFRGARVARKLPALWLRRFIIAVGGVLTLYYFGKTL